MSNCGYVQILHDLLRSDLFLDAPCAYRCVLITLLDRVVFEKQVMDDHGRKITVRPGQYLTTIRELAVLANVEKNDAERAVKYFSGIVRQEVRHRKSLFTILWGIKLNNSETGSETKKRQERDTKEEHKNIRQQHPKTDDVDASLKKDSKPERFVDSVVANYPDFDKPFIQRLIRKYKTKAVALALDEYHRSNLEKIGNPRGFFTDLVKNHHQEMLDGNKAASQ